MLNKKDFINLFLLLVIVVIPSALIIIYYSFIASDKYESVSQVSVKQLGSGSSSILGLSLLASLGSTNNEDKLYLLSYVVSSDMLNMLEKKHKIREMYSSDKIDFLSRLKKDASEEEFLKYFKEHVKIYIDSQTTLLNIKVYAYSAEDAKKINDEMLKGCENFINELSHKSARDQLGYAESQLEMASEDYIKAKNDILSYQNRHKLLNPTGTAVAIETMATGLEAKLAEKEIELKTLRNYLSDDTFQVQNVKNEISAVKRQMAIEKSKVTDSSGGQLNKVSANFEELKLRLEFAQEKYKLAVAALEATRIETSKKFKSLSIVENPTMPDEALYPGRLKSTLSRIVLLFLVYGVVRLVIAIIEDHRG